jgi:hypothetical protein
MSDLQNVSENRYSNNQPEETQSAEQINADNIDKTAPAESTQQMNIDDNDKTTPKEDSGSAVPADQVEAVTKVFSELQNAVKSEDYDQAWMLMSEVLKSESGVSFEEFKEDIADKRDELTNVIAHPDSTINIEDRVALLVTLPSQEEGMYFFFIQEDGLWKICAVEPSQYVDTSKE